jgi:outer membrane autotransporter protein
MHSLELDSGLLGGVRVEPQLQLVYQTVDLGNTRDIAAEVRFDDVESLAGRAGIRFASTGPVPFGLLPGIVTTWWRPSYWHEFNDDPRTLLSSEIGFLPFRRNIAEDWVELASGFTYQVGANTALFASSSYNIGLDGDGEAWDGRVGLKVAW